MKVAIVGLGRMGKRHCQVVTQVGLEISAVCDVAEEARGKTAMQFGLPGDALYADAAEMLERVRPDLVVVSTTAPSHRDLVKKAAATGAKQIFCEKPMGDSLAACDEMLAACRGAGVRLAINHQMRFMEQYTLPKAMVQSEALGGLGSIIVSAGNFGMAMNGTHYFEMFRYMTGERAESVSAWFSPDSVPNPRGPQFVDVAGTIRLETASGKRFYMDCSSDQGHGMLVTYNCRHGRIVVDELLGKVTIVAREPEHRSVPTTRYGMPHTVEERSIAPADAVTPTRAVLEALLKGENYPSGEDGRAAMEVLVAAHMSNARGGSQVKVADADTHLVLPIA